MDVKHLLIDVAVIVVIAAANHDVISHFERICALIATFIVLLLHLHGAAATATFAIDPSLQLLLHGQQLLLVNRILVVVGQVVDLGRVL